jgi:hypothetical protein
MLLENDKNPNKILSLIISLTKWTLKFKSVGINFNRENNIFYILNRFWFSTYFIKTSSN